MFITFKAVGLEFEAEVDYLPITPGRFSGPPEHCYPDEGGEIEILTLTHEGCNAMFLQNCQFWDDIEAAAAEAAEEFNNDF